MPAASSSAAPFPIAPRRPSAAYMMMNRGKRGLALDLKSEAGKAVLHRLLA
ncbi:CoA transferase, partial [Methylobacterium sp. WL93]